MRDIEVEETVESEHQRRQVYEWERVSECVHERVREREGSNTWVTGIVWERERWKETERLTDRQTHTHHLKTRTSKRNLLEVFFRRKVRVVVVWICPLRATLITPREAVETSIPSILISSSSSWIRGLRYPGWCCKRPLYDWFHWQECYQNTERYHITLENLPKSTLNCHGIICQISYIQDLWVEKAQHLDTASASKFVLVYQLLRQYLYFVLEKQINWVPGILHEHFSRHTMRRVRC